MLIYLYLYYIYLKHFLNVFTIFIHSLRYWKGGFGRSLNLRLKRNNAVSALDALDQLFTLARILEWAWEYAHPVSMCFVDLENVYDQVPREKLWEVLWGNWVRWSLLRATQSLYSQSKSCVPILGCKSVSFLVGVGLCQNCAMSKICL